MDVPPTFNNDKWAVNDLLEIKRAEVLLAFRESLLLTVQLSILLRLSFPLSSNSLMLLLLTATVVVRTDVIVGI